MAAGPPRWRKGARDSWQKLTASIQPPGFSGLLQRRCDLVQTFRPNGRRGAAQGERLRPQPASVCLPQRLAQLIELEAGVRDKLFDNNAGERPVAQQAPQQILRAERTRIDKDSH